jgi:crotonobetainyl-CoA:carnitine CoA-transferase CaiB-like acyl-CoA transferase
MFKQVLYAIRVLDLAPGWSAYAARLLGDLGAEVIKIEAPVGDPLRGSPDFERLNANKYGCTLDVTTDDGLVTLRRLAEVADVVIAPPDVVDIDALMAVKGSLIVLALPAEAGAAQAIAAAAGVGVALWDRRRTGEGSRIEVRAAKGDIALQTGGDALREPVSTLVGEVQVESCPWHLSESATHVRLPAPGLGEHNAYIFGKLLGTASAE